MLEGETGILRTVPAADPVRLERLRRTAKALGVLVAEGDVVPGVRPHAGRERAPAGGAPRRGGRPPARLRLHRLRPARSREMPSTPRSHRPTRTRPRRFDDSSTATSARRASRSPRGGRFPAGSPPSCPKLPDVMELADRKAGQYEAGIVSTLEAALLEGSVGKTFEAVVIEVDREGGAGSVELRDPAVTARCDGHGLTLGETVTVRLHARRRDAAPGAFRSCVTIVESERPEPCSLGGAVGLNDWILSLHVLSAFALVGAMVIFWIMIVVALGHGQHEPRGVPDARLAGRDGARRRGIAGHHHLRRLARRSRSTPIEIWDGWVIAAIVLWALAVELGRRGGKLYGDAGMEAERLAAAGTETSPVVAETFGASRAFQFHVASSVLDRADPHRHDLEARRMIDVLASIRPDSWNFPLFLHVLGAMVLVGAVTAAVVAQLWTVTLGGRRPAAPLLVPDDALRRDPRLVRDGGGLRVDLLEGVRRTRRRPHLDRHRLHDRARAAASCS